ncbi:MAG: hypothetical protein II938_02305 [Alphaproteobacteria bacterium]|nr:hypothetical protein [Alphaproteobacteria bacterium]
MLYLKDLISHGRVRACYYHPLHNKLCVKVALNKKHSSLLQKEIKNNELFKKTIGAYVPRYYKLVKTNKGLGLTTDLIYDDNNRLSPRLKDWLKQQKPLSQDIMSQFDDFFSRLLKYQLWFYDFNDENFLIKTHKKRHYLYFVDTKSLNRNNSWSTLKLEYVIPFLARRRMLRRIRRFYTAHHKPIPQQFS